jgi:hypothetical protein
MSYELTELVATAARVAVLKRYALESCIATTRVVIEALRTFGVNADPWAVDMRVSTPEAIAAEAAGLDVADWPASAWSIGMVANLAARWGDGNDDGIGHIVAVTRPPWRVLIDASIDQVAREGKIPLVYPLVGPLPADWDAAERATSRWVDASGLVVDYRPSGSRLFKQSPANRKSNPAIRESVAETIREVRRLGPSIADGGDDGDEGLLVLRRQMGQLSHVRRAMSVGVRRGDSREAAPLMR